MRKISAALIVLSAAACGEAVSKPKPASVEGFPPAAALAQDPRSIATQPADVVQPHANVLGALERPSALKRFFESLARLESGQAQDDVRVEQFGDSHTAADVETAVIRRALQSRFGDGGRGFVAIGKPWRRYLQDGVRVGMSNTWTTEKLKWEKGKNVPGDGAFGLAGIGLATRESGARAWTDIASRTARAEIAYLEQPVGGSFDVVIDGVRIVRVSTRSERVSSAFRTFDVTEQTAHQLEVRANGDGDVRVFGVSLDRAQYGVVYDALGINGAQITTPLFWNEQHWAEQLRHRAPALVVLAYGTNESVDESMPRETYERRLVDLIGRVSRAIPQTSCLLLGPPDRAIEQTKDSGNWVTAPKILEIIASQRRVAEAAGCAFYNQLDAMGGEGSIAQWANEPTPRAQKDRCHLTRDGYAQVGSSFASDVMRAYASWRKETGLPAVAATPKPQDLSPAPSTLPATPDFTE
jgi:lysophospholipase L1-like esterase